MLTDLSVAEWAAATFLFCDHPTAHSECIKSLLSLGLPFILGLKQIRIDLHSLLHFLGGKCKLSVPRDDWKIHII